MTTKEATENGTAEPPNKRFKNDPNDVNVLDVISPSVLKSEDQLRSSYASAEPYPHGLIEGIFVDGFLEQVLDEVKKNSKVKFKESDLFRVYQSIDLRNLNDDSPEAKRMPSLMKLKSALYSPQYRAFVERINHLEPGILTEEVDCAANCHAPGCHLLCHDDVIGTRKVSYIIYLTESDPEWTEQEGGALELYASVKEEVGAGKERLVPGATPSKSILPIFNNMAYFVVQPGISFHSVQEVFGDRPRLSIQGWYHAKDAPAGMEDATLSRLKSTAKGEDTEGDFNPILKNDSKVETTAAYTNGNMKLSKADYDYLAQYMNETYLGEASMREIQERFEEDSSVQLRDFLQPQWVERINSATANQDRLSGLGRGQPSLDHSVGVSADWKVVGPAHKQRFLEYVGKTTHNGQGSEEEEESAGALLKHLKETVFESAPFGRFLCMITSLGVPLGCRGRLRRFRPGLDYTVAHYGILTTKSVLDATLCFAAGSGKQCRRDEETGELIGSDDDAMWDSGDYGGFECYIAADDDDDEAAGSNQEAAAEYNDEDDTELLSVSASNNTLSLVYRDPGTMRFVKYVGCGAPSSRWDVSMEYEVDDTNEEDEKEDSIID